MGPVRGKRQRNPGDGAATLQGAAGDEFHHGIGQGRHDAAQDEQGQAEQDDTAPAQAIGQPPERLLQDRLRQAVDTDRNSRQRGRVARDITRQQHENRQHQEQAQHAQSHDTGKGRTQAQFGSVEGSGRQVISRFRNRRAQP